MQNFVKILLMEYVYINVNYGIESIRMSTRGKKYAKSCKMLI